MDAVAQARAAAGAPAAAGYKAGPQPAGPWLAALRARRKQLGQRDNLSAEEAAFAQLVKSLDLVPGLAALLRDKRLSPEQQDQALLLAELAQHGAAAAIWRGEAFPDTTFNRLADAVTATRQALLPPGDGGGTGSRSGGGGSGAWSPPREQISNACMAAISAEQALPGAGRAAALAAARALRALLQAGGADAGGALAGDAREHVAGAFAAAVRVGLLPRRTPEEDAYLLDCAQAIYELLQSRAGPEGRGTGAHDGTIAVMACASVHWAERAAGGRHARLCRKLARALAGVEGGRGALRGALGAVLAAFPEPHLEQRRRQQAQQWSCCVS